MKKTDSVLVQMLQSKPIEISTACPTTRPLLPTKRAPSKCDLASDDEEVMAVDEPRRWTKKRRLLGKLKCSSGGEDDSGTEPGSSASSSGTPSDNENCECSCREDSGCDDDDLNYEDNEDSSRDRIQELCWQLEENFRENDVS